jgi:hypothetical protein
MSASVVWGEKIDGQTDSLIGNDGKYEKNFEYIQLLPF